MFLYHLFGVFVKVSIRLIQKEIKGNPITNRGQLGVNKMWISGKL